MIDSGSSTTSYGYVRARQIRSSVDALSQEARQQLADAFTSQDISGNPEAQYVLDLLVSKKPTVHLGYRRSSDPLKRPSEVRIVKGGVL